MFTSCKDTDDELVYGVNGLQAKLQELQEKVDQIPNTYATKQELQDAIKNCFTLAQADALEQKIDAALKNIQDQLKKYVADITLNQTWNPMFGTINLPVGLSSTIAATYYGENTGDAFEFPSVEAADLDALGAESGYNKVDATRLQALLKDVEKFSVPAGLYMDQDADGVASLGKLYLSINPTEVDPDNIEFSLVTSDGKVAPLAEEGKLTLTPSDKQLVFGMSRAASENGFYETEVKVEVNQDNIDALKVNIDVEALKNAMKSAINDRTKSDLVNFAKIMMDSMKDLMPAYAVKATWTTDALDFALGNYVASATRDGEGEGTEGEGTEGEGNEGEGNGEATATGDTHTYIGKYEIAATTVQPLGYMFLEGVGTNKKLPALGSIEEAINKVFDNINIKIDDITFNPDKLEIEINLDGAIEGEGVTVADKIILTYDKTVDKVVTIKDAEGNVINQGALNDLVGQINTELGKVSGQINGSIQDAIDNIKNRLEGKLNGLNNLLSLYNSLASRINNFLADPNHYLQVMMAYEGQDGQLHQLSATKGAPSHFKGEGAVTLYPTSYTAELIAPSCKKYVAIANAWDATGKADSAVADAVNEASKKEADGKQIGLNAVISGAQQEVALSGLKSGYTYEVLYSSLDYQGHTSTRTFYFTVD